MKNLAIYGLTFSLLVSIACLSEAANADTPGSMGNKNVGVTNSTNSTTNNTSGVTATSRTGTTVNNGSATNSNSNTSWDTENSYWRNEYSNRPYYSKDRDYSMYEPAYRYGMDLYNRNPGKRYDELDQSQLTSGWNSTRGNSNLSWSDAQRATRDAYQRMYENRNMSGNTTTGTQPTGMTSGSGSTGGSTSSNSATR